MAHLGQLFFAPGFCQSADVTRALLLGGVVGAISGLMGVFVIIRGQAFAAHALADFGGTGAAAAFLAGVHPLWGFLTFGVLAAAGVELLGQRADERDLSTGIVLSLALGVEALFLYLDTHYSGHAGAPALILFGSIFMESSSTVPIITALTLATGVTLGFIYRPLLLSSLHPQLARIRGVPVQTVSLFFMMLLALVVEEESLLTGALLSTALLIGPAAAATRLTHRMGWALLGSAVLGVVSMWMGIVLAYDSFQWPPFGRSWPVSFFVCVFVLLSYLLARLCGQRSQAKVRLLRKCDA